MSQEYVWHIPQLPSALCLTTTMIWLHMAAYIRASAQQVPPTVSTEIIQHTALHQVMSRLHTTVAGCCLMGSWGNVI